MHFKFVVLFSIWWEFIVADVDISTEPNYSVIFEALNSDKCKLTVTLFVLYFDFWVNQTCLSARYLF